MWARVVVVCVAALIALSGCKTLESAQRERSTEEERQAEAQAAETRAWLESTGAVEVDRGEMRGPVYLVAANEYFAEVRSDAGRYLIETDGACNALTNDGFGDQANITNTVLGTGAITSNDSASFRYIRPRYSRIRGCAIRAVFDLNQTGTGDNQPAPEG